MNIFPKYKEVLRSKKACSSIKSLIHTTRFYISGYKYEEQACYETKTDKLVFLPRSESVVFYNSFVPVMELCFSEMEDGTVVTALFKLRKSIKVIMAVMMIFVALMELHFAAGVILGQYIIDVPLVIPVLIIAIMYIVGFIIFRICSKKIVKQIQQLI